MWPTGHLIRATNRPFPSCAISPSRGSFLYRYPSSVHVNCARGLSFRNRNYVRNSRSQSPRSRAVARHFIIVHACLHVLARFGRRAVYSLSVHSSLVVSVLSERSSDRRSVSIQRARPANVCTSAPFHSSRNSLAPGSCPYMLVSSLRGMKNLATIAHIVLATMLVLRMPSQVAGTWFLRGMNSREQNSAGKFDCNNGRYVEPEKMCDGTDNCENNEDENVCSPDRFVCPTDSFPCRNKMRCVPTRWVCDGDNDCEDAVDGVSSDEKDCPTSTEVTTAAATTPELTTRITTPLVTAASEATSSNPASPSMRLCDVNDGGFLCMDGRCLLPVQVCDEVRDCSDGADEGRFCQLVRRGNQQPPLQPQQQQQPQRQPQRQPYQQPHQHHGLRGWLVDLRMQFGMLFQPLHDSSNLTSSE